MHLVSQLPFTLLLNQTPTVYFVRLVSYLYEISALTVRLLSPAWAQAAQEALGKHDVEAEQAMAQLTRDLERACTPQ